MCRKRGLAACFSRRKGKAMGRIVYHVEQRPDGKWAGKKQGIGRASVLADTEQEAVQLTIAIARKRKAQVIVHGRDGGIREERTYPRSTDPRRHEG
jgi:hypothetical protein